MRNQQVENLFGALSLSVTDAIARGIEKSGAAYGSDAFALVLLSHTDSLRSDVLSRQLGLAQSSTVRLVDRLQREGLLQRAEGKDRRTVLISLTARGRRAAGQILSARERVLSELVSKLSGAERTVLRSVARKLLDHLTVDLASGEQNCRLCDEGACVLAECPVEIRYQTFEGALLPPGNKGHAKPRCVSDT